MQSRSYEHSQPPEAVLPGRAAYRDTSGANSKLYSNNLMYDRRVIRGSTYATNVLTPSERAEAERIRQEQTRKQKSVKIREVQQNIPQAPSTPPPVEGREHIDVQTDTFLEELTDKPIEIDEFTQTEAFMDRPPTPRFIPVKQGTDEETQIAEGDLFDFDFEVEPILEVLVGKTLEQSMMEVLEEEELAAIRKQQREFEQRRNAELAEVQKLEAEELRKEKEKERRVNQEKQRVENEKMLREKIASRTFAKRYLANLHDTVFAKLAESGHFYDPLSRAVDQQFLPWVYQRMTTTTTRTKVADAIVKELFQAAIKRIQTHRHDLMQALAEEEEARRAEALVTVDETKIEPAADEEKVEDE